MIQKVGFGGGCHWCTEAVFASLLGVKAVHQGWISSDDAHEAFSEAVIVEFDPSVIGLETLTTIHIYTHSSTSSHSMRGKYRSAVYFFCEDDAIAIRRTLQAVSQDFDEPIVTLVLPFKAFDASRPALRHYYYSDAERPFCTTYIDPKLRLLLEKFSDFADVNKIREAKMNR